MIERSDSNSDFVLDTALNTDSQPIGEILLAQADTGANTATDATPPQPAAAQEQAALVVEIQDGSILRLPEGASIDAPRMNGANLEFVQPDGSVIVVPNGAIEGLTIVLGNVEIPPLTVASLFAASDIQTAAGPAGAGGGSQSSGGNFDVLPAGDIGSAFAYGDLLDGTELPTTETSDEETFDNNLAPRFSFSIGEARLSEEGLNGGNADLDGNSDTTNNSVYSGNLNASDPNGDPLAFRFGEPTSPVSSHGVELTWTGVGTSQLSGWAGDTLVVQATVSGGTGAFTVTLFAPVDHAAGGGEDNLSFDLPITATDGRGGSASTGIRIIVEDDSPTVGVTAKTGEGAPSLDISIDETVGSHRDQMPQRLIENGDSNSSDDVEGALGRVTTSFEGGLAALFNVSGGYGADGAGSSTAVFSFAGFSNDGLATNLSATHGGLITLFLEDGVIIGKDATGDAVFKIEIVGEPGAEQLQTTLLEAIAHTGDGNTFDERAVLQLLGDGAAQLKLDVTRTDFDGDTTTNSATVNLVTRDTTVISFEDDGPTVNSEFHIRTTVDEDDISTFGDGIPGGSLGTSPNDGNADGSYTENPNNSARGPATVTGSLAGAVEFGSDGAATPAGGFSISTNATSYFNGLGLTSNGEDLSFSTSGNRLTATAGEGRLVFEFTVKANGEYEFRLYDQLDHDRPSSGADQNYDLHDGIPGDVTWLDLGGAVRATDGDGDWVDLGGKLEIRIRDDVPELARGQRESVTADEDDIDTRWSEGTSPNSHSEGFGDASVTGQNGAATVQGSLAHLVHSGADENLTFSFRSASYVTNALENLGLSSGGNALEYEVRDGVLYAYVEPRGPNNDHTVFKLTLTSDGGYKFELFDQLNHDSGQGQNYDLQDGLPRDDVESINFGKLILATDHDGDSVSLDGAFDIRVRDDVPELAWNASVSGTVEEEALLGGNEDRSATPDIDEDTRNNPRATDYVVRGSGTNSLATLVETGADENGKFAFKSDLHNDRVLTSDGASVRSDGDLVTLDRVTGGQDSGGHYQLLTAEASDGRDVFTLKVYDDGDWEFKLLQQLDHQYGDNKEGFLTLDLAGLVKFTDADGDNITLDKANFTVRVIDDMPEIALVAAGPSVTIDETGGSNNDNVSNIASLFNGVTHPTDPHMATVYARDDVVNTTLRGGADDIIAQSLKLQIDNSSSGLFTTDGQAITLVKDGEFILGKAGNQTAFAIQIDGSGRVSIAQYLSLKNPVTSNPDDRVDLAGKISVAYSVTDHDGDTVTKSLQIGSSIQFEDDGPRLTPIALQAIAEDTASGASNSFAPTTLSNISLNATWGADGPHAQNLAFTTPSGNSGLTSNGQAISYSINGTLLTAAVGSGPGAREIFTVRLNGDGTYTFKLSDNIDHASGSGSQPLSFGFKATDGDGDSVTGGFTVNVTDSVPTIGTDANAPETESVSEQNLPYFGLHELFPDGANSLVQPGKLNIDWNADDSNSGTANRSVEFASAAAPTGLTSDGKAIVYGYSADHTVLTATAGGQVVFTVALSDADTGSYTFRLLGNIDHAVGTDTKALSFSFIATDSDHDTASSSFTVNLLDDQLSLGSVGVRYVEEEALPHGNEDASPLGVELSGALANVGLIGSQIGASLNIFWGNDDANKTVDGGYNGTQVMGDRSVVFASELVSASGGNGAVALTSNGQPLVYTLSANGTVLTASAGGHNVFSVTLSDQANGSYTFKLLGTLDHPVAASGAQNEDVLSLSFNFTARDGDGDQGTGNFVVRVIDDSPEIGAVAQLNVSETTLDYPTNTFVTQTPAQVSLNIEWGADGAKTNGLSFTTHSGAVTGLTSNGEQIAYSIVGNVLTASAGVRQVFTVTLNSNGTYSFVLSDNIDHAAGSNDKALNFGFQATDGDSDTATGTFSVHIKDTVPVLLAGVADAGILSETTLPSVSFTSGSLRVDLNADDNNHVEIAKDSHGNYILPQGLTSDGVALDYEVRSSNGVDQEIVAFKHGETADQPVFIVAVVRPGNFAATLFQNLDHAAGSDTLAINLTARVYDGDRDYVDRAFTVNVGDTKPELVGQADSGTLVESSLPYVSSTFGSLHVDLNADDAKAHVAIAKDVNGNYILPQGLTSDGVALDYIVRTTNGVDQEIVAFKHGQSVDQPVFIVAVLHPGSFVATLFQNLDHLAGSDTLAINLTARVYDGDGDYVDRAFTVNVADTVPELVGQADTGTLVESSLPSVSSTFGSLHVDLNADDAKTHVEIAKDSHGNYILPQGLTSDGVALDYIVRTTNGVDQEIVAFKHGQSVDQPVFIVAVLHPGSFAATLFQNLDHLAGSDMLAINLTARVYDGDGDYVDRAFTVNVGDTVPELVGQADSGTLVEGNLPYVSSTFGSLHVDLNADDRNTHVEIAKDSGGNYILPQGLTSDGVALDYIVRTTNGVDQEIVAFKHGETADQPVFIVAVVRPGNFAATLFQNLDHAAGSDTLAINLTARVYDGDGDYVDRAFTVNVGDDVPTLTALKGDFNLLTNGDFADGSWTGAGWGGGYATEAVGWKITGTEPGQANVQLEFVQDGYLNMHAPSGGHMVDLGSSPGDTAISQSLTGLTVGQAYTLTFAMGSPDPASAKLEVYWNGQLVQTSVPTGSMVAITIGGLLPDAHGNGVLTFKEVGTADYTGTYLADIGLAPTGAVDLPLIGGTIDEDGTATINLGDHFSFGADGAGTVAVNPATVVITTPTGTVLGQPTITVDPVTGVLHVNPGWGFGGLSEGEIATLTIPYTVTDHDGDSKTGLYQLIINGHNDQVSTSIGFPDAGTITEYAEGLPNAGSSDARTEFDAPAGYAGYNGGGFWIYDDQGDTHSVSVIPGANAGYLGTLVANVSEETAGDGNGFVTWQYSVTDAALNPLQAGEEKIETFTVRVSDGHGSFADRVITVTLVGTNDSPVINLDAGDVDHVVLTETNAGLQADGTLSVTDVDVKDVVTATVTGASATGLGSTFTVDQLKAFLSLGAGPVIDGTHTAGDIAWHFNSGSEAFNFLANGAEAVIKYTIQVSDGHGGVDSQDVEIKLIGTNDRPVVDLNGTEAGNSGAATAVEQLPQYILNATALTAATISDVDSSQMNSMTVKFVGRPDGAYEVLSLNPSAQAAALGLSVTYDAVSGVLTITGAASTATYQTILQGVSYINNSDTPSGTGHSVEVIVNDGHDNSTAQIVDIKVIPLNDAPVLGGSLHGIVVEGGSVVLAAAELGYTDPDNTSSEVVFRVSSPNGGEIRNNGALATSFTAAELAAGHITFVHDGSENAAGFTVAVEDGNQDGSTPVAQPFTFDVVPVNDAPVVDLNGAGAGNNGSATAVEQTPQYILNATTLTAATISDVDSSTLKSMTISFVGRPDGTLEVLSLNPSAQAAAAGLSVTYNADFSVLTITGAASTATYQTILQGVSYINNSDTPTATGHSVEVIVNDGTDSSTAQTVAITVTPLNDAPVLGGTLHGTVAENGTLALTAAQLGYTDLDNSASEVVFQVTGLNGGQIRNNGAVATSFTATELSAGKITFVHDGSEAHSAGFSVAVEDGNQDQSTPVAKPFVIDVTPVNDLPSTVVDTNSATNEVAETAAAGTVVGLTAHATDPDGDTLTYSLTNDAGGRFAIDQNTGVVTVKAGAVLDFETTAQHTITVQASDGHGGIKSSDFTIGVKDMPEGPVGISNASAFYAFSNNAVPTGKPTSITLDMASLFVSTAVGTTYSYEKVRVGETDASNGNNQLNGQWSWLSRTGNVISGNPDPNDAGAYILKVIATAPDGTSAFTYVALTALANSATSTTFGDQFDNEMIKTGQSGGAAIFGQSGVDVIIGNAGNNQLSGDQSQDALYGGAGDDYMDGGSQSDFIAGGVGTDLIYGQDGDDVILGEDGDDYIDAGSQNDIVLGGAGDDIIYGQSGNDVLYGDADDDYIDGGAGNDVVHGGTGNDTIYGLYDNDVLFGDAGNDTIHGGDGADTIYGGAGDDVLAGDGDNDTYIFGLSDGKDVIQEHYGSDKILIAAAGKELTSFTAYDNVAGNNKGSLVIEFNDQSITVENHFKSSEGQVELIDFDGASYKGYELGTSDYKIGASNNGSTNGNDFLVGEIGVNNTFSGGGGNDLMFGADKVDTLSGGSGNDLMIGNGGNDILSGDGGDDFLWGGLGKDTLTGGTGHDTFVFSEAGTANADTIKDYVFGDDVIDLSDLLGGVADDQKASHVQVNAANNTISVDRGSGWELVATIQPSNVGHVEIKIGDDLLNLKLDI